MQPRFRPTQPRFSTLARIVFPLAATLAACSSSPEAQPAPDPMMMPAPVPGPVEAPLFDLSLSTDKLPVLQGASSSVEVTVTRQAGFAGAITITQIGLPGGASLPPVIIAADQTKATLTVAAAESAPHSLPTAVSIRGTSEGKEVTRPLTVTIYGAPGVLDTSFAGGKVVVPVGAADDYAYAMAAQSDGKILLAGRAAEHLGDFAVVRLERDGAIDAAFGTGGKVITDLGGGSDSAQAIAVQADGKILVAGNATVLGAGLDFALVRYNPDGSLDPSFGTAGKVTTTFGNDSDNVFALLIQPDGKIVLGGDTSQGSSTSGVDFALARYNPDGSLDASFGVEGKVVTSLASFSGRDSVYALALQDVGGESRIVAAGGEGDFMIARYTAAGQLDASFGAGGKVTGLLGSTIGAARAVKIAADGSIVLAGHGGHDFALCRLTSAGALDPTFGSGGRVITAVSPSNWDEAQALTLQTDGKIVVAGWAYEQSGSSGNFALARYSAEGQLDASFGGTGMVLTEVAAKTKADQATAVLLQADERIPAMRVLVGGYANGSNNDFAVTRYWR